MAPKFETSTVLEHRQHLAGIGQLWPYMKAKYELKMGMGLKQYHKCQITNNELMTKYESHQWVEISLGLKQYHKCQITNNGPAKYGSPIMS
jgi:hypothetical protein